MRISTKSLTKARHNKIKYVNYASPLALLSLSACGGSEENNGETISLNVQDLRFSQVGDALSLSYFNDESERGAVRYFYSKDIDSSPGQEVLIAGFETQPNTAEEYSNTNLFILDVDSSGITNITYQLLPGETSFVEGVGDLVWGDFNGDDRLDFFTTAYTDFDFAVNAYSFMGSSSGFERTLTDNNVWQHGASVYDINADGYDDVYVAGYSSGASVYLGSATGLVKYTTLGDWWEGGGGSAAALGDFLNNGEIQVVVVDTGISGTDSSSSDTVLFELVIDEDSQTVDIKKYSVLSVPLLEKDSFDNLLDMSGPRSHDIRVEALDFNSDGLLDVVVFSRGDFDPAKGEWPRISQVQFLENTGNGVFADVTETILPNYEYQSNVGYQPVFADFNNDGYLDIFISDADYGASHSSSVFLLGSSNGQFEEIGRNELSALIPSNGGMATVVEGVDDNFMLLVGSQFVADSGRQEQLTLYNLEFV